MVIGRSRYLVGIAALVVLLNWVTSTGDFVLSAWLADPDLAPVGQSFSERESIVADAGVEIVVRSVEAYSVAPEPAHISATQEEERKQRLRNSDGPLHFRLERGLRDRAASGKIDLSGDEPIPVIIELAGAPPLRLPKAGDSAPAGMLWVGLEIAAAREQAIIERKKLMPRLQADLAQAIEGAGGSVSYASWTSGSISAQVPGSMLEKLAQPRKGITAHVWCLPAGASPDEEAAVLPLLQPDRMAARDYLPLPVLGVPGWWPANEDPSFYDDTTVFRPLSRAGVNPTRGR